MNNTKPPRIPHNKYIWSEKETAVLHDGSLSTRECATALNVSEYTVLRYRRAHNIKCKTLVECLAESHFQEFYNLSITRAELMRKFSVSNSTVSSVRRYIRKGIPLHQQIIAAEGHNLRSMTVSDIVAKYHVMPAIAMLAKDEGDM